MVGHRVILAPQTVMSLKIRKRNNEQSRRCSKQRDSTAKKKQNWTTEDKVKLQNNFYSAKGQLKTLERRLLRVETLKKRYQETINADVNAEYVRKVNQTELKEIRDKLK